MRFRGLDGLHDLEPNLKRPEQIIAQFRGGNLLSNRPFRARLTGLKSLFGAFPGRDFRSFMNLSISQVAWGLVTIEQVQIFEHQVRNVPRKITDRLRVLLE